MSNPKIKKTRINMYLPDDLLDWLWKQANKNGFNLTTMVQMIILDYKKQQEAIDMTRIVQMLKEYEDNNPK